MEIARGVVILVGTAMGILIGCAHPAELRVIDGDTLVMDGQRVRLFGIDAPEIEQPCRLGDRPWYPGPLATDVLRALADSPEFRCSIGLDRDKHERVVARCYVGDLDVGAEMVRRGWAMDWPAYSRGRYWRQQEHAREHKLGIWQAQCAAPWEWRWQRQQARRRNR